MYMKLIQIVLRSTIREIKTNTKYVVKRYLSASMYIFSEATRFTEEKMPHCKHKLLQLRFLPLTESIRQGLW